MQLNDLAFCDDTHPLPPILAEIAFVDVKAVTERDGDPEASEITLKLSLFGKDGEKWVGLPYDESRSSHADGASGRLYSLQKRHINFTSMKCLDYLADLAQPPFVLEHTPAFMELLQSPLEWGAGNPGNARQMLSHPSHWPMTASQQQVFACCCGKRLQVVWGPPGSGKTYFSAVSALRLICAHQRLAPVRPFRVLVTSVAHKAIDNLLLKVKQLADAASSGGRNWDPTQVFASTPSIFKLGSRQALEIGSKVEVRQNPVSAQCVWYRAEIIGVEDKKFIARLEDGGREIRDLNANLRRPDKVCIRAVNEFEMLNTSETSPYKQGTAALLSTKGRFSVVGGTVKLVDCLSCHIAIDNFGIAGMGHQQVFLQISCEQ
jgi:hypothetical protein